MDAGENALDGTRYAWIRACAEAWPLTSVEAHRRGVFALQRGEDGLLVRGSRPIMEEFVDWAQPRARGHSLRTLRELAERAWLPSPAQGARGDPTSPRTLAMHVHDLAHELLSREGGRVVLKTGSDAAWAAERFRWISSRIPVDLLVTIVCADGTARVAPLDLLPPQVARALESSVAETHLHLGAATSFDQLWVALISRAAQSDGAPRPRAWMASLALVRLMLGACIRRARAGTPGTLSAAMADLVPRTSPMRELVLGAIQTARALVLRDTLRSSSDERARGLAGRLTQALRTVHSRLGVDASQDPLASLLGVPSAEADALLVRVLAVRARRDEPDEVERLFWQYQRARVRQFGELVEEPSSSGLDWFGRATARGRVVRGAQLAEELLTQALRVESRGISLESLEVRVAPTKEWEWPAYRTIARAFRNARDAHTRTTRRDCEIALTLTLRKPEIIPDDPRALRAWKWFVEQREIVRRFGFALRAAPEILHVFRGLDVAGRELALPLWPVLPLIRWLRARSREVAANLYARWGPTAPPPFRVTFHAGEDFPRLIHGLRRVHELVEFGLLEPGDRIGHGMALGLDPAVAALRGPRVVQRADDRLDDLLWEMTRYREGHLSPEAGRRARVEGEAAELGAMIYGGDVDPWVLARARRLRHDARVLASHGFAMNSGVQFASDRREGTRGDATELVRAYLQDVGVRVRGAEVVEVTARGDENVLVMQAQRWLRRVIALRSLTVETNPSSNLVIGDLPGVEAHPALLLFKARAEDDAEPVTISINSDDPLTFATSLADEYAYLYYALVRRGVASDLALTWIDRVRANGWRSRFSIPASATSLGRLDAAVPIVLGSGARPA